MEQLGPDMQTRRNLLIGLGALGTLAALAAAPLPAQAASFPDHPIRLLVGFPPGGGADLVARLVAQRLGPALGTSVLVENKAGANGTIAAAEVARSPADGYTLLLGVTASQSISPVLMAKPPYDPLHDFSAISMVGVTQLVLVVNPKLPVASVQDFIAYTKAAKDPVTFGSAGVGNITHMAAELFVQSTGANMRHIPYKGSSQVITDLIGGQVQAYFDTLPSSLPFIQGGQLRALAVTGAERSGVAPDIPTMKEAGVADYLATNWFGLLGPRGMEGALVSKINGALAQGFASDEARKAMAARGVELALGSPERFDAELAADLARWRAVTKKAGITVE